MDIITDIVSVIYKRYGPNTLFKELDYSILKRKNYILFYRARTLLPYQDYLEGDKIIYDIQYHKFNVSPIGLVNNFTKKCMLCDKKSCDYRFNCCKQFVHSGCLSKISDCCFDLKKTKKEDECIVCYENCFTKTNCGHIICQSCIKSLKKDDGSIECPMCRRLIKCRRYCLDIIALKTKDDEKIKVRVTEL